MGKEWAASGLIRPQRDFFFSFAKSTTGQANFSLRQRGSREQVEVEVSFVSFYSWKSCSAHVGLKDMVWGFEVPLSGIRKNFSSSEIYKQFITLPYRTNALPTVHMLLNPSILSVIL